MELLTEIRIKHETTEIQKFFLKKMIILWKTR